MQAPCSHVIKSIFILCDDLIIFTNFMTREISFSFVEISYMKFFVDSEHLAVRKKKNTRPLKHKTADIPSGAEPNCQSVDSRSKN